MLFRSTASDNSISKPYELVTNLEYKLIGKVYFNNNEFFIDASDREGISRAILEVEKMKPLKILVVGHTDLKLGVDNMWLSKERALAVSNFMSIKIKNLTFVQAWYASTRPAVVGLDKNSLAKNRRVEIFAEIATEEIKNNKTRASSTNLNNYKFKPISFNRNEYFLDAQDRRALLKIAEFSRQNGCDRLLIQGTSDETSGGIGSKIGDFRAGMVKKYLLWLDGNLRIQILPSVINYKREIGRAHV